MSYPHFFRKKQRGGFTVIDMVTATGIISVISAVVIVAINPRLQFTFTYDSTRKNNAQFLENCFTKQFEADRTLYGEEMLNEGEANKMRIGSDNPDENSIDMRGAVPNCLAKLPRDPSERCIHWSGYSAYLDADYNVRVTPDHLGVLGLSETEDTTLCGVPRAPGVEVRETDGGTITTEGGPHDTYTVRLTKKPTANVTVRLTFDNAILSPDPAILTFTPGTWGRFQTVSVIATDDPDTENSVVTTITHAATSTDTTYNGIAVSSVSVTVNDDDVPGVTVVESSGSTIVNEDPSAPDHTDSYTVVLDSRPTADVVVPVVTDTTKITADKASLTFTRLTWNVPQIVTITPVNDDDIEGPETTTVDHDIVTTDPLYQAVTPPDVDVNINDNDLPTIIITGAPAVNEATPSTSSNYQFRLAARPVADVQITVAALINASVPPQQVTINGVASSLYTFTPGNWSTPQTVQVRAIDDLVAEGNGHLGFITHTVTSTTDPNFNGATLPNHSATITDNDSAGIVLTPSSFTIDEDAANQIYQVRLLSQPRSDVTVTVTGNADLSVSPSTLTFTSANWNSNQPVTIDPVNDTSIEGRELHVITNVGASSDIYYDALARNVDITLNDDERGLVVSKASVAVNEDGTITDSYTVKLSRDPAATLTARIAVPAAVVPYPQQASLHATNQTTFTRNLTFTSANWNTPQNVDVRGVNDAYDEASPHSVTLTMSRVTGPATFFVTVPTVTVNITDDDAIGVLLNTGSVVITETGTPVQPYTMVLTSRPTGNVVVNLNRTLTQVRTRNAGNTADISTVTFTNANWNVPQTINVRAVDDFIDEASPHTSTVSHTINVGSTADTMYDGLTGIASVIANITDNDTAGFVLTPTSTTRGEPDASTSYLLRLATVPTAEVVVSTVADSQGQLTDPANDASIRFRPGDWNVNRTINIQARNDYADEDSPHPGLFTHTVTSTTDPNYTGKNAQFTMNINDNDTADLLIVESGGTTAVAEGGTTDTYTIRLATEPTATVTVTLDAISDQVTLSSTTLTFNPTGLPATLWSNPRTITVTAVNDTIVELSHADVIRHTATGSDIKYQGMTRDVNANITDNDRGVFIGGGSVDVTEGGATDTFTARLSAAPGGTVRVTPSNTDGQVTYSPPFYDFTDANFSTPRTFTVTAVNDDIAEGNHTGNIRLTTSSTVGIWNGLIADVIANITDNDTAGVTITPTTVDVAEGGATDTYDIVLTSQPRNDVTITINPDTQVSRIPTSRTFTSANWNIPQNVLVGAIDDFTSEGNHVGNLTHTATSADPTYNSILISPVVANITDNDGYGLIFDKLRTTVSEAGVTDTYGVKLSRSTFTNVRVDLTGTSQAYPSVTSLNFDPITWNTYRYVTVTAVNDLIAETTPHTTAIAHTVWSSDANYNGISVPSMPVDITDNDTAGIIITETAGDTRVSERSGMFTAPHTDTYSVRLTSQPTAPISVFLSATDVVTNPPLRVDFTTTNWNTNQNVSVTGIDDGFGEGDETINITHNASGDSAYDAIADVLLPVDVVENDPPGIVISPNTITLYEAGTPTTYETYTVQLQSRPATNVRITPTPSSPQFTVTPAFLDFTSGNWNTPQTFRGQAIQDTVAEGNVYYTISHTATGDAAYVATTLSNTDVLIIDDDPEISVEVDTGVSYNLVSDGSAVSYGSTTTGTSVEKTFRVTNIASPGGNLSLSTLVAPAGYSITQNFTDTNLAPGESTTFRVRLNAASVGTYNGEIRFDNSDGNENPFNINVSATVSAAPQPEIDVYLGDIASGTATPLPMDTQIYYPWGELSTKVFTVRNVGAGPLTISSVSFSDFGPFSVTEPLSSSIAAGSYDTFTVRYNTSYCGSSSCFITININNNDSDENPYHFYLLASSSTNYKPNMEVSVKGTYRAMNNPIILCDGRLLPRGGSTSFDPPSIDVGLTGVGDLIGREITIRNVALPLPYGTWPLDIFGGSFVSPEFSFGDLGTGQIFAGQSRDVMVRLLPTSQGAKYSDGVLNTSDSAIDTTGVEYGCRDHTVIAAGTAGPPPEIQVDDSGLAYVNGSTVINQSTTVGSPVDLTIQVRNIWSNPARGPLLVSTPTLAGSSAFQISTALNKTTVDNGDYAWFTVRFNPPTNGSYNTVVTIPNNDDDENPFTFTIQGDAGDPDIEIRDGGSLIADSTGTVNFGVTPAATPVEKTLTIRNTGFANLSINNTTIGVPGHFTVTQAPNSSVVPGGSTTMKIAFDGQVLSGNGTVTIYNNDPDAEGTYTFTVTATATANPEISVEDVTNTRYVYDGVDTVDFGSTVQGTPVTRILRIHNHGLANLTLDPTSTWTVPAGFTIVNPLATTTTITPSNTLDMQVRLTASAVNSYSGTFSIQNSDSTEDPFDLTLAGQVTVPPTPEVALYNYQSSLVVNGGNFNYGNLIPLGLARSRAFTFFNTGNANLTLGTLSAPAGFTLESAHASPIGQGGSTSFTLRFDAGSLSKTVSQPVSIATNDTDENPYNVTMNADTTLTVTGNIYTSLVIGNILYLGGEFTSVNGVARTNLAAIDVTTGQVTNWMTGMAPNGAVRSLLSRGGASIYAAGDFTRMNTSNCVYIGIINLSPGSSAPNCPDTRTVSVVVGTGYYDMALSTDSSRLFAVGKTPAAPFTALNTSIWTFLPHQLNYTQGAFNTGDAIYAIAIDSSDNIYLGGDFTSNGPNSASALGNIRHDLVVVRYAQDALNGWGYVLDWNNNAVFFGAAGEIRDLALYGSNIYVAGSFSTIGGKSYLGALSVLSAGVNANWSSWNTNGTNGAVNELYTQGTNLYVGGQFTQLARGTGAGFSAYRLGKFNLSTGLADTSWLGDSYESPNQFGTFGTSVETIIRWGAHVIAGGVSSFVAKLP